MGNISKICEHMPVVGSDGRQVGFVTRLLGSDGLLLTSLKEGHGFEHLIPLAWVDGVDRYVFLNRSSGFVTANWETTRWPHGRARAA